MGRGSWGRAGTLGWLQHQRDLAKPLPLLCACFSGSTFGRGIMWTLFRGCSIIGVGLLFFAHRGAAQEWDIWVLQSGPCGEWFFRRKGAGWWQYKWCLKGM